MDGCERVQPEFSIAASGQILCRLLPQRKAGSLPAPQAVGSVVAGVGKALNNQGIGVCAGGHAAKGTSPWLRLST